MTAVTNFGNSCRDGGKASVRRSRRTWASVLVLSLVIGVVSWIPAGAQVSDAVSTPVPSTGLDALTNQPASRSSSRFPNERVSPLAGIGRITAPQIIAVLDEQPQALVEVKSLLADLLSRSGNPVQE